MVIEMAIDVRGISIVYKATRNGIFRNKNEKDVIALSDVSMEIRKGEIVALIGKNGAGKSTLLSAIGGHLRPESGTIETVGKVYTLKGSNPGLIPHISSRENVRIMSRIYGFSDKEVITIEKAVEDFCELGDAYDRKYSSLSSGMAGRVGFGFTTSLSPQILLMDETLGVGDAIFREKAMKKAMNFMDSGETILISTHSMNLVKEMCSRGIVLDRGKVVFDGTPDDSVRFYVENIVSRG